MTDLPTPSTARPAPGQPAQPAGEGVLRGRLGGAGGQLDERNPDKSKRDRKVTGLQIYWDLVPHGDGWKGEGYSPEDGRYYKAHLRMKGGQLTMKGCVSVFCRTVTWTKMS